MKVKQLFFDIETCPNIGLFWQAGYKQNIPYDNIIQERRIICICYKWRGEKQVHSIVWDKNQNDKTMLQQFVKIANEADELIGHNGDKFDLPWIKTRCLFHGIPMFPSYTTLDILKAARSKFKFQSNTLNYIAGFLGLGSKNSTSFDLWKKIVLKNDKKSLNYMIKYCKQDVVLLEKVYLKLANYITSKTHHGMLNGGEKVDCPECGSKKMKIATTRISASGLKRIQLQCTSCGKYHTVSETTYKNKDK